MTRARERAWRVVGAMSAAATVLLPAVPVTGGAQQYRARVDASSQAVSFRGLVADSIPAGLVVPSPSGGLQTADGYAVRCGGGPFCAYMRPGPVLQGVPTVTSASVILWGLGVEGLSFRATGRLLADLGPDKVWPGTEPAAQLIQGYFEYQRSSVLARAGRLLVASRLEHLGFDGAWVRARWDRSALEVAGYGGWGLAQASALPVTSPALDPLDEWRPRDRQIVAGAEASWFHRVADLRAEYRREIDPLDNYIVSERGALSWAARVAAIRAAGGVDVNVAEGHLGSADLTLTWLQPRYSVSAGGRRYRPYFSLWTLWGAFSPVPYHAVNGSAELRAGDRVSLHARGERYWYDDAEVSTGLVPQLVDRGWRGSAGATATAGRGWTFDATLGLERGPGASGRFADAAVNYAPGDRYSVDLYGGTMARPLELRFYDATSRWIGGRGEWRITPQRRVWGDLAVVDDQRERPDAGASSLTQLRARAGLSIGFGSGADRTPLPPARRSVR